MKEKSVTWPDLPVGTHCIEAIHPAGSHVYRILERTQTEAGLKLYGSDTPVKKHCGDMVIVVSKTSYDDLPVGSEFIPVSVLLNGEFSVPADILLKQATYAHYIDMNRKAPERDTQINGEERVFNLGLTFLFGNVTVAVLNT